MTTAGAAGFTDYYALLGLLPGADTSQIRLAFLRKAKQYHPDAGGSTETMQLLNTAYQTLRSDSSKRAYDMLHNFHTGATELSEYRYEGGTKHHSHDNMADDEIDTFLDTLFNEYRNGVPAARPTLKQRIKRILDI